MLRFRINELLAECNEGKPREEHVYMPHLAEAVGAARSTLAGLTTLTYEPVTNTATFEALCRFFHQHHPNFQPTMLIEFVPPLGATNETHVGRLYPRRATRGGQPRQRRE